MSPCDLFRGRLEQALRSRPDFERLRVLGWHEHLFGCSGCRSLLEAEEALEALIGVLPEVELPVDLATRVLARLESLRSSTAGSNPGAVVRGSLDGLLERDRGLAPPAGLGARTYLAVCDQREEAALDRLLERVSDSPAPQGLAQSVIAGLHVESSGHASVTNGVIHRAVHRGGAAPWAWAAAALALFGLGLWLLVRDRAPMSMGPGMGESIADVSDGDEPEINPDLLASLDLLENWELLMSDDVDVFLGSLGSIGELGTGTDSLLETSLDGFDSSEGVDR